MYTNIPVGELLLITENLLKDNGMAIPICEEIIQYCKNIANQKYCQHNNTQYAQVDGLAMGAPTSSIFSEIYLQRLVHTKFSNTSINYKIFGYFRYVDDILLVYNKNITHIHSIVFHRN
jgi:hypothetical protein